MQHGSCDRLQGVLAPVLTPFDAGMKPDILRFTQLCRWLVAQDCGLAMFGTNSEGNSLAVQERLDLLAAVIDAGVPADRMLPGTGSCSLTDAVDLTRAAVRQRLRRRVGAAALLLQDSHR